MPAKVRDVIRRLEAEGWRLVRVAVSDHVYKREAGETITIPVHGSNKELSPGVYGDIAKRAGWK